MIASWIAALLALAASDRGPDSYALEGARIFVGTGEVLERGTLVVERGLVVAVGPSVEVPEHAWVIDAGGKTIYPGFIDALGTLGVGKKNEEAKREERDDGARSRGPEDRPATFSWKAAADELTLRDDRIESWRESGFTSAVSVFDQGIFSGQAAFINLAGERERDLVVRTPLALRVNFEPLEGGRNFPESLMGVLAYVKQAFADAAHYRASWTAYENAPLGKTRPAYDRAIAPLARAQAERWPVLLPAHEVHEIDRALALAREAEVRPVLYGLHEGYAATDLLVSEDVAVLVSLDWPKRDEDEDPGREEPLRVLELRDRAPSTPGALEKAGIRFAFYAEGLEKPAEAFAGLRRAIEAGLSKGRAVTALSLDAARIFGLDDRLGSLEPGKIANFFVASGDVFAEGTRIETVFVDGRKNEVRGGEE